ncbi:MAG: putative Co/Zn/Cd efflux system rane fusion protein [Labilithrix sp.]|nr:putative Co/Zn/Cd efflux system rane fusion protein [Labilithrix sp.]
MSLEHRHEHAAPVERAQAPAAAGPRRMLVIAIVAVAVAAACVVAFLVLRKGETATAEPPRDVPTMDGKWIRYSPAFAQRAKLEFATAEAASLMPVVNVTGAVTFDPERVAAVGARISGRVRKILKFPGDPVKAGDALCEIESADLGQAQSAVLAARAHASAADANDRREKQLAEARVSAARDAELARATAESAQADLHAAEQRVRALGGDSSSEIGVLLVRSPIPGKIVESHVSRGQSVEPSATLFRVADLERLWIELAVFERELGHISAGNEVEISPQTNLAVALKGKVAHVGDVIEQETRSGDVRVVVDNPDGSLRPGQSVLAKIHTKTTPAPRILLPRDAVTSIDGKATVFVAHDATSVEPRAVVTGARDGTRVEITEGVQPGERVATGGVFALKSEIFR